MWKGEVVGIMKHLIVHKLIITLTNLQVHEFGPHNHTSTLKSLNVLGQKCFHIAFKFYILMLFNTQQYTYKSLLLQYALNK